MPGTEGKHASMEEVKGRHRVNNGLKQFVNESLRLGLNERLDDGSSESRMLLILGRESEGPR